MVLHSSVVHTFLSNLYSDVVIVDPSVVILGIVLFVTESIVVLKE